jgi:hypothetical protein
MNKTEIIKKLDWEMIFGNSSQIDNLYEFLSAEISLEEFQDGFYPRSKNKRLAKLLKQSDVKYFRKHGKKLWNLSNVQEFSDGDESEKRAKYISKL